jgi:hypothetical protein
VRSPDLGAETRVPSLQPRGMHSLSCMRLNSVRRIARPFKAPYLGPQYFRNSLRRRLSFPGAWWLVLDATHPRGRSHLSRGQLRTLLDLRFPQGDSTGRPRICRLWCCEIFTDFRVPKARWRMTLFSWVSMSLFLDWCIALYVRSRCHLRPCCWALRPPPFPASELILTSRVLRPKPPWGKAWSPIRLF